MEVTRRAGKIVARKKVDVAEFGLSSHLITWIHWRSPALVRLLNHALPRPRSERVERISLTLCTRAVRDPGRSPAHLCPSRLIDAAHLLQLLPTTKQAKGDCPKTIYPNDEKFNVVAVISFVTQCRSQKETRHIVDFCSVSSLLVWVGNHDLDSREKLEPRWGS